MKNLGICSAAVIFLLTAALPSFAQSDSSLIYVTATAGPDRFALAVNGRAAPLLVDARDHAGVLRAAGSFRDDVARVTGTAPELVIDAASVKGEAVLIGTIGKSALIDRLVRERKLDVTGVAGQWETFAREVVEQPLPGIERALVIAGSDKRGTIYGIYDLSSQIGVSPWYWWADAPVRQQKQLFVLSHRYTLGAPAVKYRGFFINDEAPALSGWAHDKFGGFNHDFYEKVFELLLRMKGNFLWPAMWGNAFYDDDAMNPRLADEYGVVIGTSHHEPLMRAHDEWRRYGKGPWNYQTNEAVLKEFWRASMRRTGSYESLITVGMRGDGDAPMSEQSNIALLEKIVADQRQIISEVTGKAASATPQVWALYKEVQDYYDRGMRVPDDVTLLFADDNWGNVRRLPAVGAPPRAGGYGVYYHFDYVGGPRNYKWINTNQIERVWEQMGLAYQHGVDRIWIVNVGDIKPMEFPLQFFLDYAWNPKAWPAERLPEYTRAWVAQQFNGLSHAEIAAIAEIMEKYTKFNSRRKPELLSPETYQLKNYREWHRVVSEYNALAAQADHIYAALPVESRSAFYQLVLYPVKASANINDLYGTVARNRFYASLGHTRTNDMADRAEELFANDARMSAFYNDTLAAGKWSHMMDQTRIGYTYWQQPPKNTMPNVMRIELPAKSEPGVSIEGSDQWWPQSSSLVLPEFDAYNRQSYYIEVFNRGQAPFGFNAKSKVPWLKLTPAKGKVQQLERVTVTVDWERAPPGVTAVPITVSGSGKKVVVQATVNNTRAAGTFAGFIESNGYVSIDADHYDRAVTDGAVQWVRIPNLGRTGSAMEAQPLTTEIREITEKSPHLEYRIHLAQHDSVRVHAYASPTLDFNDRKGLRYGVSLDNEKPQVVNLIPDTSLRAWERAVADNIRIGVSRHAVTGAGEHVLKFWLLDPGVVLQKLVVDAGGLKPSYLGPPESPRTNRPGAQARFDWFEYEGRDPVYASLKADDNVFLNPILPGFYPDPSITRAGADYYLVTSTFSYFPGVPVFHSRDLVNWTQIGSVLERASQLPVDGLGVSRGVFAPQISYHDSTFYMITTLADAGGNLLVTAKDPAGPWSDPVWLGFDGIDPSLFFDDDGRVYIINNGPPIGEPLYPGHRALWLQEYDPKSQKMVGERKLVVNGGVDLSKKPIWIEAPHILRPGDSGTGRLGEYYYLIAAEGGTAEQHSEVVFRSKSVWGPWEPYSGNPILTQRQLDPARPFPITSSGHADFVQTQNGEWWAVFLAARPYKGNHYNTGRETFMLPVQWRAGWPHILDGNATIPYALKRPNLPLQPTAAAMKSGNFIERDDFSEATLPRYWTFLRTVREQWYDLHTNPGWLTLQARPQHIGKRAQPSFVARRQQHAFATASTAVRFTPQHDGDKAGIVAFQNDDFYYLLAITLENGKPIIQLEQSAGANANGATHVLASAPLTVAADSTVYLKIDAQGELYDFSYTVEKGKWIALKQGVDGTFLSTKTAQGFVGAMIGMYAYAEPAPPSKPSSAEAAATSSERWVGTWGTAPQLVEPANMPPAPGLAGNTLRQVVRATVGGNRVRLRLSNAFGNGPLVINAARIARSLGGSAVDTASTVALTFSGKTSITVPAGSAVLSDPFSYTAQPRTNAAITIYFGDVPSNLTGHPGSRTTSYVQPGDAMSAAELPDAVKTVHWYVITGIDVVSERDAAVVVLGNSITDGRGSTTDQQNRWPDQLANRLHANRRTAHVAVLNQGIGGNCVVHTCLGPAAMDRFERDVLGQNSARWLIVLEGVNDIGRVKSAEEGQVVADKLIVAYQEMIAKAHARGMRVYGATIMPFGGSFYDSPEREQARQTVNSWIRNSGKFDAVIDTDAALRDPAQPTRLLPAADTGDHLHPNELGHRMIAESVNLALFEGR